jgi:hypothetical protein
MYYAGIDYHKRYSVVSIQDAQGEIVQEQRGELKGRAAGAGGWGHILN